MLVLHQLCLYLPSWAWVGPTESHRLLRRVRLCRIRDELTTQLLFSFLVGWQKNQGLRSEKKLQYK